MEGSEGGKGEDGGMRAGGRQGDGGEGKRVNGESEVEEGRESRGGERGLYSCWW